MATILFRPQCVKTNELATKFTYLRSSGISSSVSIIAILACSQVRLISTTASKYTFELGISKPVCYMINIIFPSSIVHSFRLSDMFSDIDSAWFCNSFYLSSSVFKRNIPVVVTQYAKPCFQSFVAVQFLSHISTYLVSKMTGSWYFSFDMQK